MALVTNYVFDNEEIAYVDASGVVHKNSDFWSKIVQAPYKKWASDQKKIFRLRRKAAGEFWTISEARRRFYSLSFNQKRYWRAYDSVGAQGYRAYWVLGAENDFSVVRGSNLSYGGFPCVRMFHTAWQNNLIYLLPGYPLGHVIWFPVDLTPYFSLPFSDLSFSLICPQGAVISVSFCVAFTGWIPPDISSFSPFPANVVFNFIPPEVFAPNAFLWIAATFERPLGDLNSVLAVENLYVKVYGRVR